MYTDRDLDDAVAAGVLSASDAAAFRAHAARRAGPLVDEEQFRLITGFNDIFVVIAIALVLYAVGWIGVGLFAIAWGAAAAVAGTAWGLAEYFTRVRRMALPSIVLLLVFVGAVFAATLASLRAPAAPIFDASRTSTLAIAAAIASLAAWLHWRRFHVPITVAAGVTSLAAVILFVLLAVLPDHPAAFHGLLFTLGLAVFALAMRWDLSDPKRQSQRSDVAFWLHLVAAPMLVQPVFMLVRLLGDASDLIEALAVVTVYLGIGIVALAIDRRALLVSALAFLLSALSGLFEAFGAIEPNIALAALVVGGALLMLSAFWDAARRRVIRQLPDHWRARLPRTASIT